MLSLIIVLVVGSIIAYLSLQNTTLVSVHLLDYTISDLPLYYVIIGSMLIGLLLSYVIYLGHSIYTSIRLHSKDKKLRHEKEEVAELTKRIHKLELENVKLKKETDLENSDNNSL